MFERFTLIAFGVTVAGVVLHCLLVPCARDRRCAAPGILRRLLHPLTLLFGKDKQKPLDILRRLVYLVALVCCVALAITGFYPLLVLGRHISGYPLMLHATCAPVFSVCLAVLTVMWAGRCAFKQGDCPVTARLVDWLAGRKGAEARPAGPAPGLGQKLFFWLLVCLALPLILSVVLSMFPVFGPHQQELLLAVHRYVAVLFVLSAIVHAYLLIRAGVE